jgi:hypothetical protein
VANKLSAIPLTRETSLLDLGRPLVPMSRIGCPLLLKTNLLHELTKTMSQYSGSAMAQAMSSAGSCRNLVAECRVIAFASSGGKGAIIPPETISAAYWP